MMSSAELRALTRSRGGSSLSFAESEHERRVRRRLGPACALEELATRLDGLSEIAATRLGALRLEIPRGLDEEWLKPASGAVEVTDFGEKGRGLVAARDLVWPPP